MRTFKVYYKLSHFEMQYILKIMLFTYIPVIGPCSPATVLHSIPPPPCILEGAPYPLLELPFSGVSSLLRIKCILSH